MLRATFLPSLLIGAALAGCTGSGERAQFAMFASELPWPEPVAGCEAESAPPRPKRYDEAAIARTLAWVHRDQAVESFCGCPFDAEQNVIADDCGYLNGADVAPAVTWMHVVPPSRFGVYRECWKRAGDGSTDEAARLHCARHDAEYRTMATDLYNFLPAVGGLAELRGDHPFGNVQGEPRDFGVCDFESQSVMGKSRLIEPPENVRGDIARVYLYMAAHYGKGKDWKIKMSREQRLLLEKWHEADPVDDRERRRACRIAAIQGWQNPYVK